MLIAVVNASTQVSNDDVNTMCQAVQIQLDLHAAPAWNQKSMTIRFYADKTTIPGYAWLVTILDSPDQAGALGYHDEVNDKINGFIFTKPVLDNGGVILYDANNPQNVSVSSVLSHEVLEMFGDRFANFWADGPAIAQGDQYALELCDPVEGNSYVIDVNGKNVSVSNFIFPSWFNAQATAPTNMPFDYLKLLKAPFTMTAGGYMIVRSANQAQQVFGEQVPNWKKEIVKSEVYRR
jgi:hypothetical protein